MKAFIFFIFISFSLTCFSQTDECTIGVANGEATTDGRPMVWKTRDYATEPDNEVKYNTSYPNKFIMVANAGSSTSAWMGVNEYGFAIVNSNSTDLPDGSSTGPSNGVFMRDALGNCKTVAEFQDLLDQTNITGRTTNANFGVIDSTGEAVIFETANTAYWKFDSKDAVNNQNYVLRTNFAINGGGSSGTERLIRTVKLVGDFSAGNSLNFKSILRTQMRDFSNNSSQPVTIPFSGSWGGMPFGYIETSVSICRSSSVSAAVIQGTLPTERAGLATMWTILSQPSTSVALPYWPVAPMPGETDGLFTSPLCDVANNIKSYLFDASDKDYINTYKLLDGKGGGLWTKTFPFEDQIFAQTNNLMTNWRTEGGLPSQDMKNTEDSLAAKTYDFLQSCLNYIASNQDIAKLSKPSFTIYPNPLEQEAMLIYSLEKASDVLLEVFTLNGQKTTSIPLGFRQPGNHEEILNTFGTSFPSGMLIIKLTTSERVEYLKVIKSN